MSEITIRKPGGRVKLNWNMPAVVIGALIKANGGVLYEVSWWKDNENKTGWMQECEIEWDDSPPARIGFSQ